MNVYRQRLSVCSPPVISDVEVRRPFLSLLVVVTSERGVLDTEIRVH
jgi:hypothetical protein